MARRRSFLKLSDNDGGSWKVLFTRLIVLNTQGGGTSLVACFTHRDCQFYFSEINKNLNKI